MKYLFNSSGNWIAFKIDRYLYASNANWIGWFPWEDEHAVDKKGNYLGSIFGNRFYRKNNFPYRGYPGYPGNPGYPGYPGYPSFAGYSPIVSGATDFTPEALKAKAKD